MARAAPCAPPRALLQAAAHGAFYVPARNEDHALLIGAIVLFAALATVMWLARRTDWHALGRNADAPQARGGIGYDRGPSLPLARYRP